MAEKKAQEHTFLENGKIYYNMISEDRIREIIREEIAEYNKIFMSQSYETSPDENEWASNEVNADALQNEENWPDEADVRPIYNDAQMINGTFEGDTISQKGKQRLKQPKKGLNTDSDNPDSGE